MAYVVLARKYRPQNFEEVAGQGHIADLLQKAITADRIAHAYLFCGPRGIGKTSCARILAKSLNCEQGPTLKPCGQCSTCQEITKGTSFDVMEIDGASNRGIDEIRALRESVKFAPSYGRFKIYVVDEVHMLTSEAFNALLKTLEEPPPHVKFIFATTEIHKVPATIISRCQRFDFKRIPVQVISETLARISTSENFTINQEALYAISKAAQGSLRDALSILDQLSALSSEGIKAEDVYGMLGLVETALVFKMIDAIASKNCAEALTVLEEVIDKGKDVKQLMRDLLDHGRHLMVIKVGGKALGKLVDYPIAVKENLLTQCELFTLPAILNMIDVFISTQESARIIESARLALEVALARLTVEDHGPEAVVSPLPVMAKPSAASPVVSASVPAASTVVKPTEVIEKKLQESSEDDHSSPASSESMNLIDIDKIKASWDALTYGVSREKMSVASFLQEGVPLNFKGHILTIGFPPHCVFHKETLESSMNKRLVESVFREKLKAPVELIFQLMGEGQEAAPQEDEVVQEAMDAFQGKVVSRWHND